MTFKRVLLKLSGEALAGDRHSGIDPAVLARLAAEIKATHDLGIEIGIVVGGGNMWRGVSASVQGMDRVSADYMGMLATVMNALALQDALERLTVKTRVMSAIAMNQICEPFISRRATRHLEKGRLVIFACGTGNPYFTTDTAAALRAKEIGANVILKATKVDGVYDKDPNKHADAVRYETLSYDQVINQGLEVMDTAAFALARDSDLPLRVFDMGQPGELLKILRGENIGTLVRGRRA